MINVEEAADGIVLLTRDCPGAYKAIDIDLNTNLEAVLQDCGKVLGSGWLCSLERRPFLPGYWLQDFRSPRSEPVGQLIAGTARFGKRSWPRWTAQPILATLSSPLPSIPSYQPKRRVG